MTSFSGTIKRFYRRILPLSIRQSLMVTKVKSIVFGQILLPILKHNAIYDQDYFETAVDPPAVASAGAISSSILNEFKPASVIDVGCGTGSLLSALREKGCNVFGVGVFGGRVPILCQAQSKSR